MYLASDKIPKKMYVVQGHGIVQRCAWSAIIHEGFMPGKKK